MSDHEEFVQRGRRMAAEMASDESMRRLTKEWFVAASAHEYSYHFQWLGMPVIQFPQDLVAMQEIIWEVKPKAIVETGIARGGSLVFHASLLELIGGDGFVLGVDIDIRAHNREAIEKHPMSKRIRLLQGSSIDPQTVAEVRRQVNGLGPVLVILDSNHVREHVSAELDLYSSLVGSGSYLIVLDTIIDDMPDAFSADRPWGPGRGPKAAVEEFLRRNDRFVVDQVVEDKLSITVAPGGYLRCVKD